VKKARGRDVLHALLEESKRPGQPWVNAAGQPREPHLKGGPIGDGVRVATAGKVHTIRGARGGVVWGRASQLPGPGG